MSSTESEKGLWWNWVPRCIVGQLDEHGFGAEGSSICMNEEGEGSSGGCGCNGVELCWWFEKLPWHRNEHSESGRIYYCECCEVNVSLLWFLFSTSLSWFSIYLSFHCKFMILLRNTTTTKVTVFWVVVSIIVLVGLSTRFHKFFETNIVDSE